MRLSHARAAISRAVRRSEPRVVRRAGPGDGAGRPVRADSAADRAADARREGRRERGREDPRAGRRDGRRRGLDRRHGPAAPRRHGPGVRRVSARRPRWARSCARSPSVTSASSTRSPPRLLARLAAATPLLPGADQVAFVDIDDTVRQTYGYAKQGAGRGYTGVKGLNALLATVSTPMSAPVIAATRLRKGATNSARGAANCWPTRWPPPAPVRAATGLVTGPRGLGVLQLRRSSPPAAAPGPGSRSPPDSPRP